MKKLYVCLSLVALMTSAFGAKVTVTAPDKRATLQSPVHFQASATTKCSRGISAIGIYTAPGQLDYVVNGGKLNTNLKMAPGDYDAVVQEWDNCGGGTSTVVPITVKGANAEGVFVTSPAKNAKVGSSVHFSATAITGCNKGVAAMGIYTAPGKLAYVVRGAKLNTDLNMNPGTHDTVVQEWDDCGGGSSTPVTITVGNGGNGGGGNGGGGKTLTNLHNKKAGIATLFCRISI